MVIWMVNAMLFHCLERAKKTSHNMLTLPCYTSRLFTVKKIEGGVEKALIVAILCNFCVKRTTVVQMQDNSLQNFVIFKNLNEGVGVLKSQAMKTHPEAPVFLI